MLPNEDDAVIWRGPKKNALIKQFLMDVTWGDLDFLIIDTPPGTSDEHISIVQYLQPGEKDGALIVTTPQEVSLSDVKKEVNFCKKTNTPIIGVVENMAGFVCPCCNTKTEIFKKTTGGAKGMCDKFGLKLLGSVPLEPCVSECCENGKAVVEEHPDSLSAKEYTTVFEGLLKAMGYNEEEMKKESSE